MGCVLSSHSPMYVDMYVTCPQSVKESMYVIKSAMWRKNRDLFWLCHDFTVTLHWINSVNDEMVKRKYYFHCWTQIEDVTLFEWIISQHSYRGGPNTLNVFIYLVHVVVVYFNWKPGGCYHYHYCNTGMQAGLLIKAAMFSLVCTLDGNRRWQGASCALRGGGGRRPEIP